MFFSVISDELMSHTIIHLNKTLNWNIEITEWNQLMTWSFGIKIKLTIEHWT